MANGNCVFLVEFRGGTVGIMSMEVTALSSQAAEQVVRNMYGNDIQISSVNPLRVSDS